METIDILRRSLSVLGYKTETFIFGKTKKSFTEISHPEHNGTLMISTSSPLYPFAIASSRLLFNDKSNSYDFAAHQGVTIPVSIYIEENDTVYEMAHNLLDSYGRLIVKPLDSSLSNGLTLDISSHDQLVDAIVHARQFSDSVIVQQQIMGEEVRFVVVDGKVRAAILRQTPSVFGDGVSPLSELIAKENEDRKNIKDVAVSYPLLDDTILNLVSFDMERVYPNQERIELGKSTMIKGGASIFNIMDTIDPTYIADVERLVKPLGNGFIVADLMLCDYANPATSTNYAFIEFNITPALVLFYSCRDGKHFRAAEEFLAPMIDTALRRRSI